MIKNIYYNTILQCVGKPPGDSDRDIQTNTRNAF